MISLNTLIDLKYNKKFNVNDISKISESTWKANKTMFRQLRKIMCQIIHPNFMLDGRYIYEINIDERRVVIDPSKFHKLLPQPFCGRTQEDVQEFYQMIFEKMHIMRINSSNQQSKMINTAFKFTETITRKCMQCKNIRTTREAQHTLQVIYIYLIQIFWIDTYYFDWTHYIQLALKKDCYDIQSLIENYFKFEVIDELVFCSKCNNKTKTAQQYYIAKSPSLLYAQLKYFKMDRSGPIPIYRKSNQQIWIQKEIRIDDNVYLLSSAIIHKGAQREQGHYLCIGRSLNDCKIAWSRKGSDENYKNYGEWYYANDKMKRNMEIDEVNQYLLTQIPDQEHQYKNLNYDSTCVYIACYVKINNDYIAGTMPSSQLFSQTNKDENQNKNTNSTKAREEYEFIDLNTDDETTDMHFYVDNQAMNHHNSNCQNNNETYNFSTNYNQKYQYTFHSAPSQSLSMRRINTRKEEEKRNEERKIEETEDEETEAEQEEGVGSDGDTIMNDHASQIKSILPDITQKF